MSAPVPAPTASRSALPANTPLVIVLAEMTSVQRIVQTSSRIPEIKSESRFDNVDKYEQSASYGTVTALTVADRPPVRALFSIPWTLYSLCSGCPATSGGVVSVKVAVCEIPI